MIRGVDEDERRLQEVDCEHRDFLVLAVVAGQLGVLAVEDEVDPAVPVLDDLSSLVDFVADGLVGEVLAEEDRLGHASEFVECSVGGGAWGHRGRNAGAAVGLRRCRVSAPWRT